MEAAIPKVSDRNYILCTSRPSLCSLSDYQPVHQNSALTELLIWKATDTRYTFLLRLSICLSTTCAGRAFYNVSRSALRLQCIFYYALLCWASVILSECQPKIFLVELLKTKAAIAQVPAKIRCNCF